MIKQLLIIGFVCICSHLGFGQSNSFAANAPIETMPLDVVIEYLRDANYANEAAGFLVNTALSYPHVHILVRNAFLRIILGPYDLPCRIIACKYLKTLCLLAQPYAQIRN